MWFLRLFGVFLLGVLVFGYACLSPAVNLLGRSLHVPDDLRKADVIVAVSAGKLRDCRAHPYLFQREHTAANLLKSGFSKSGVLLISGIYTRSAAPKDLMNCRDRLAALFGIPSSQLLIDNTAETTQQNAAHSRILMDKHHWRTALLVTSRSHMRRALGAFRKQGVTAYPVSVPDLPPLTGAWLDANRRAHLKRFLYEYGALIKYKWYGYI